MHPLASKTSTKKKMPMRVVPSNIPCFVSRESQMEHMGWTPHMNIHVQHLDVFIEWSLLAVQQMKPTYTHQAPLFFSLLFFP